MQQVSLNGINFLVASPSEAREEIKKTIWAFPPSQLVSFAHHQTEGLLESIKSLQQMEDDLNPLLSVAIDVDALIDNAITQEGAGALLAIDGRERTLDEFGDHDSPDLPDLPQDARLYRIS